METFNMQPKTIQQCVIKICLFQHLGTVGEESLCNLLLLQEIRFTAFFEIFLHPDGKLQELPCMISLNIS